MKKQILFTLGVLCALAACRSQSPPPHALTIGDKVPDIKLNNLINYSKPSARISDFRGRLVILDFMSAGCSSCIEALPRLNALQKQFAGKLQIVLVTSDKMERITSFMQKSDLARGLTLPVVPMDSLLTKAFPHQFIPHEVWINGDGIVKAITTAQYINSDNITTVLSGEEVHWPVKMELPYDYNQPILAFNHNIPAGSRPGSLYYSVLTGYMNGVPPRYEIIRDSLNNRIHIYMINLSVIELYRRACNIFRYQPSHILLEVGEKANYLYDPAREYKAAWEVRHCYTYEGYFPLSMTDDQVNEEVRKSLNAYLELNGRVEKRSVHCLSLVCTDPGNALLATAGEEIRDGKTLRPLSYWIWMLNQTRYGQPVLDNTNLGKKIYLPLKESLVYDLPALRKELEKYGLDLKPVVREQEMFVLTENGYKKGPDQYRGTSEGGL